MKIANKMANVLLSSLVCMSLSSLAFAEDFSKKTNDELISLNGTLKKAEDAADLAVESMKRAKDMGEKARKEFKQKLKESWDKNTEKLSVKEFREYEANVKKEIKARLEKLGIKGDEHEKGCACEEGKSKGKHKH